MLHALDFCSLCTLSLMLQSSHVQLNPTFIKVLIPGFSGRVKMRWRFQMLKCTQRMYMWSLLIYKSSFLEAKTTFRNRDLVIVYHHMSGHTHIQQKQNLRPFTQSYCIVQYFYYITSCTEGLSLQLCNVLPLCIWWHLFLQINCRGMGTYSILSSLWPTWSNTS